jgi:hypothetical protein
MVRHGMDTISCGAPEQLFRNMFQNHLVALVDHPLLSNTCMHCINA